MVSTQIMVGSSASQDPALAASEAAQHALAQATEPVFAMVLSTACYEPEALAAAVSGALGDLPWAGLSTAGVFVGKELLTQGVVIGVICGPEVRVGIGVSGKVGEDGRAAGNAAASQAVAGMSETVPEGWHRAFIVLCDVLTGNGADVVRGAVQVGGTGVAWAGGGAGDDLQFARTAQYAHGKAHAGSAVVIALDTRAPMAVGVRHGFRPYGPPTMVTCSVGSALAELEFEPAFAVYQRAVAGRGDRVTAEQFTSYAMTHPLGIPQASGEHVIRDPLRVDAEGTLHCVGEVPDGCLVRVMEGDRAGLVGAAQEAARAAKQAVGGAIGGAIVFDCVSRSLVLGEGVQEEIETFGAEIEAPVMGCFTFGEVGSLGRGVPQFHNKTAVVLALGA
ncbi:FIST signal transduction protein [Chondromyces apiculatus]|uniref:Uncharacterized protein n=1 Tax=Chondromyces apiculatus DSM 436 TaxID=1192034 RepID=A0A017SVU2_9BACT|nr:FIST N-terminal domain-containing protein [Chondromyces apiculatus]EYF01083.1 Hypothetical protein CAP_8740 [Chondromyces apiculatus DSM 436]